MQRCAWVPLDKADYVQYHDLEWGVPVHDDRQLFEMLILEGSQAGLNWYTILKKRAAYRQAFHHFDPEAVSRIPDTELETLLNNPEIIRNRLKVYAARDNARIFLTIQKEFGSFDAYIWRFVDGQPLINRPGSMLEVPARNEISDALSKDLKKRGMRFVGPTIIYAYMQAVGMVNDHSTDCFKSL
ncbi:DNA-3-methyladenine glycosylase I [Acidithiobacillus sp. HP-6]|uniref:DNA-3-methyladenine glycosylase I n=1 Tax=unclassified Acidithiobacillus TaxID=2614800 RepID=UPI00187AF564|nr:MULTISPECIES: DNA-3-methyladenine glycosylase I [unclassified Acidithiobacillus]MBE7564340.1 DNA-3-methyladenine glycosylase I [Acidithiobacillus sp. HP-6]MBE7570680.1 DNA-3-methyladenine glycosylase I [Acidithiobacillus sp. HP-2]